MIEQNFLIKGYDKKEFKFKICFTIAVVSFSLIEFAIVFGASPITCILLGLMPVYLANWLEAYCVGATTYADFFAAANPKFLKNSNQYLL